MADNTRIIIKDRSDNIRYSFDCFPVNSVGKYTLGKEDYISIPFSVEEPIGFRIGDYVDLSGVLDEAQGGKFAKVYELTELPTPEYNTSTGGYDYELKLEAYYRKWKNKIFKYTPESGGQEASWNLTASLDVHLGVFVRNLKALGYKFKGKQFSFSIDDTVENAAKLVSYDNTNLLDALTEMAETWDCEWWVEENQIRFGRCENSDAVKVEIGVEASEMSRSESSGTYATRVYAFGSTRNITANYRPVDESVVVNGVVQRRLMLPSGTPYIDAYRYVDGKRVYIGEDGYDNGTEMPTEEAIEDVVVFDDVYPRTQCVVGSVSSYDSTTEDEETGESVTQTFYYVTDTSTFAFDESYILSGEELHMIFESGSLNGMDFAVTFRKKGSTVSGVKLTSDVYEIVANEDYGRSLPDDTLKPAVGDKFILYNWDSSKLSDSGLITEAENELLTKAKDYVRKTMVDDGTYNVTLASSWVYEDEINRTFDIGQRIELINKSFFEDGRTSRVVGFETKLDIPYDAPVYSIGESTEYSRVSDLEDKVEELTYKGQTYNGSGGSGVYVIRTNDSTAASNSNVYSALRSRDEFLNRKRNDRAKGLITIEGGINVGLEENAKVDAKGNAEVLSLIIRTLLGSPVFVNGMTGEGWRLWLDESGLSHLEIDELTVRQRMDVFEMLINKVRSVGGQMVISAANGKVESVAESGSDYVLTLEADNMFQPGDLVRCQTFTGGNLKNYWAEISSVDGNTITIAKSEFSDYEPEAGDEIVLMGSTSDSNRQSLISISATDDGQPRIDVLNGVSSKDEAFTGGLRARLGNLDGIYDSWFPADNQPHGDGLYADNAYLKGTFLLTTGEDIKTKLEIVEGSIKSSVEALKKDIANNTNSYLANPCFLDGMAKWQMESGSTILTAGDNGISVNSALYAKSGTAGVALVEDDGHNVAYINGSYLSQLNADMAEKPTFLTNEDGESVAASMYLSFFYKVTKKGTLTIGFENTDKSGFEEYDSMSVTDELDTTDDYVQYTCSGLWNGTGDFKMAFTGEMYVYMLVLTTDEAEALAYRYRTLFEQSEKLVRIAAANFDKDGNVLESSQIITTAKYNELISQKFNSDGSVKNTAGLVTTSDFNSWKNDTYTSDLSGKMDISSFASMFSEAVDADTGIVKRSEISSFVTKDSDGKLESGVYVVADQIKLEGLTTVNDNFKVLEDGSIEAVNGSFSGSLQGVTGSFKQLTSLDSAGTEQVSIKFGSSALQFSSADDSGQFWFYGDIWQQGTYGSAKRKLRFYGQDVLVRSKLQINTMNVSEYSVTFTQGSNYGLLLGGIDYNQGYVTTKGDFYNTQSGDLFYNIDNDTDGKWPQNVVFVKNLYRDVHVYVGGMSAGRPLIIVASGNYDVYVHVNASDSFQIRCGRGGIFIVKGNYPTSATGGKQYRNNILYTIDPVY